MQYISFSVCEYIKAQVERYKTKENSGKALIVLPSFSAGIMVGIGKNFENQILPMVDQFVYKIAKPLWKEWELSDSPQERACLEEARKKDWLDNLGNLTHYRNEGAGEQDRTMAVILGGMDHVTDAGSLSDFHCCEVQTIWQWPHGMNTSFDIWIKKCLNDKNIAYEEDTPDHFDEVLKALLTRVPTDILRISEFLDSLDLSGAQDGRDAEQILLKGLGFFGLPDFKGFRFGGRQKFAPFVETALSFFSYAMFLEKRPRDNAIKAVKGYQKKLAKENRLSDDDLIGNYSSDDEFLNDLADYINEGDKEKKTALLECDFTIIRDKILKYKAKKKKDDTPPKIKKLGTDPLESVLTGLWLTLGVFKKELEKEGGLAQDVLKKIHIKSFLFKHDCDGDSQNQKNEIAIFSLKRVIGGIDHWLNEYIEICGGVEDELVMVVSELINDDMDFQYSAVAEPVLGFQITIEFGEEGGSVNQRFYLRLPEASPFRIAVELFQSACGQLKDSFKIPVFSIPYFDELMLAKDEEEAHRVLMHGIREENTIADFLGPVLADLQPGEIEFGDRLKALSHAYQTFISHAAKNGLYGALTEKWDALRRSLDETFDMYLDKDSSLERDRGGILARAFLMVNGGASQDGVKWIWQPYESAAAVTVLHPALLELVHARIRYLFDCFNAESKRQLKTTESKFFKKSTWDYYLDLAAIKMPLCGLLKDDDLVFETAIRGENLLHRIGGVKDSEAALSTRLLLRYDAFEDDDISDREMFHETRESLMLFRIFKDYWKIHPHANDGISLAVYQNQDMQPVIAAIDQFINDDERKEKSSDSIYHVSVTLFSESSDDTGVRRWIEQWKERWEAAENHAKFAHYRTCRLSISHRIVTPDDNYAQFIRIINSSLEADIAILSHFISAGVKGNRIEKVPAYDVTSRPIQFPVLEKASCAFQEKRHADERFRVLSNRQFRAATKHLETMARLKEMEPGNHIALGRGDFSPWRGVINALHKNVEWVACIDSNIDEQLLKETCDENVRDLIGFGSGVGSHGEANYTISTEQFHFSDLLHKLKAAILNVVEGWSDQDHVQAAQFAIEQAKSLSGLSLIRATGMSRHIHDVMAYALARKKFSNTGENLCDQFISLDAYRHWFDNAQSNMRPDILWLTASITAEGIFHLDMRIIECKFGKKSDMHLEKAREQVDSGLRHLIPSFMPRQENDTQERPDARYWWLQLHRLIASKSRVSSKQKGETLTALERLVDGEYSISWGGAFFTCWTNVDTESRQKSSWTFNFRNHSLDILHVALGSQEMKNLCSGNYEDAFDWGERIVSYEYKVNSPYRKHDPADEVDDLGESDDDTERDGDDWKSDESSGTDKPSQKEKDLDDPSTEDPIAPVNTDPLGIPDRIFLGYSANGSRQIFWEFGHDELNNRHMLIFGSSGMGKTYTIQCLLNELGSAGQNSLVVDYTNGFLPDQLEEVTKKSLAPEQHIIRQAPFPISPFKLHEQMIGNFASKDTYSDVAKRVAAIFKTVYDLGDQQFSVLFDAIITGMESHEDGLKLDDLLDVLEDYIEDKKHNKSTVQSTLSKLKPFVMGKPFTSDAEGMGWNRFFEDQDCRCHIFQLAGLDMHSWRLVTEFILWDLYAFVRGKGNKNMPKVVVLDEIQNLDHREECPLAKYLTEGRKFGLALVLATQTLSNLANDQQSRLFQAGHKLFFKPADTEMKEYGTVLQNATGDTSKTWIDRLSKLKKGECYSLGPSLGDDQSLKQVAVKISITAMEDRGFNG